MNCDLEVTLLMSWTVASPAMEHWGTCLPPPRLSTISFFSSLWSKSESQLSQVLCSLRD